MNTHSPNGLCNSVAEKAPYLCGIKKKKRKDMAHDHHHHTHQPTSLGKAFRIAVILNLIFVVVEFTFGFIADSVGLMSDAGHNLSDVVSLVVAWVAVIVGTRKASLTASWINSVLLVLAVAVILYESVKKLFVPEPVDGLMMIIVAAVGVFVNLVTTLLLHRDDGDINVHGAFLHMLADTLVSVGVVVSGIIILRTDLYIIDPIIGLVVGIIILVMTIRYIRDVVAEQHSKHEG